MFHNSSVKFDWCPLSPSIRLSRPTSPVPVDYQTPSLSTPKPAATLHSDRDFKFREKSTPSLGGASSSGVSEAKIVFKKRKNADGENRKNFRRREDE